MIKLFHDESEFKGWEKMREQNIEVRLRSIEPDDLPLIFQFQIDVESNQMAFTHPRSVSDFDSHWAKALVDPSVVVRAIIADCSLAGCISCIKLDNEHCVGYWIGKEFWGKGIASRSLKLLLEEVLIRPLYSRVAVENIASTRVLEKCGFQEVCRALSPATERYVECEEVVMKLSN